MKIIGEIANKSEFIIFLPKANPADGNFIYIQEGSGAQLDRDDAANGYVDYIDYSRFAIDSCGEDIVCKDGGLHLLKQMYNEMSEQEIVETILEAENIDIDNVIVVTTAD